MFFLLSRSTSSPPIGLFFSRMVCLLFLLPFFSFPFLFPFSYPFFFLSFSFLVLLLTLLPLLLLSPPNRLPNRQDFIKSPPYFLLFSPSHYLGPSQRCSPTFPLLPSRSLPPHPPFPLLTPRGCLSLFPHAVFAFEVFFIPSFSFLFFFFFLLL